MLLDRSHLAWIGLRLWRCGERLAGAFDARPHHVHPDNHADNQHPAKRAYLGSCAPTTLGVSR
jgi:hypothetical protein